MRGWVEAMADRENTPEKRVARNQCPECCGDLDTGYECTRCGHDALTIAMCGAPRKHDFAGPGSFTREFDDGLGAERVCGKCGIGAMAASLLEDF